ncbi:unnamed protein product [Phaedon cochleariae]|uniref:Peptidase C19 ubiquitin carboxyl-terminal hydrolase domain-containing protein n=1 Tax=Phaedon cochleariae TaxID=80249 RepID=A0A9N9SHQ9_PHACE|nr:unnamed protein product [Phaedon cochleariae]
MWNRTCYKKIETAREAIPVDHMNAGDSTRKEDTDDVDAYHSRFINRKIGDNFVAKVFEGIKSRRTKCLNCQCVTKCKKPFFDIQVLNDDVRQPESKHLTAYPSRFAFFLCKMLQDEKKNELVPHRYKQCCVIMHSGCTMASGYYIAYMYQNVLVQTANDNSVKEKIRQPEKNLSFSSSSSEGEDMWLECNDGNIKPISTKEFVDSLGFQPNSSSESFLLFYTSL